LNKQFSTEYCYVDTNVNIYTSTYIESVETFVVNNSIRQKNTNPYRKVELQEEYE